MQVFATIYETEGLAHHMAVERAHVSCQKEESHVKGKVPVRPQYILFYLFYLRVSLENWMLIMTET